MAEKRKPALVVMLRKPGKRARKAEIFHASLWPQHYRMQAGQTRSRYRLRADGKWFPPKEFRAYTVTQIAGLLRRSLREMIPEAPKPKISRGKSKVPGKSQASDS